MVILRRYAALLHLLFIQVASADVSCGGHYAKSCGDCPYNKIGDYMGPGWCNGDCKWSNGRCVANVKTCGNGAKAISCSQCPSGESGCGNTDCAWHTSTDLCRDAFSDAVRTASVHLSYPAPAPVSKPAWWFQRVVPLAVAPVTYFSTSVHDFGYGGIQQVDDNTGRVIFSLWDQGGCDTDVDPNCDPDDLAKTVACGKGVTCTSFGGEGTGRKSFYDREPFKVGVSYYFVTQAVYLGNSRMEYTGYFYEEGNWRLLSRIQVSTNANQKWWMDGIYSFVEQWSEVKTTSNREAAFGPSYMASKDGDDFQQIKRGIFTHGTLENHQRVNARSLVADGEQTIAIATGGDTKQSAKMGDVFTYKDSTPYEELTSFKVVIGCLNDAKNRVEIESCLEDSSDDDTSGNPCDGLKKKACKKIGGCVFVNKPKKLKSCKNKANYPGYDCASLSSSKKKCLRLRDNDTDEKVCIFKSVRNPNLGCRPE